MRPVPPPACAVALLVTLLLAGCADGPGAPPQRTGQVDLITPGAWNVTTQTERILAWAHNAGPEAFTAAWALTAPDGGDLPPDWLVSFDPAQANFEPNGTKRTASGRTTYPDWQWTLVTLNLPAEVAPGDHTLRLAAGPLAANVTVHVASEWGPAVTGPGSRVTVDYRGTFTDSGQEFDSGQFPTTLGSRQTVPGFDYGLMGLQVDEPAALVLPPALAYGYDNDPRGRYARFNGEWLTFEVTVVEIEPPETSTPAPPGATLG